MCVVERWRVLYVKRAWIRLVSEWSCVIKTVGEIAGVRDFETFLYGCKDKLCIYAT